MNLMVMLNKEWMEMVRTYRLFLVPLLFILIALAGVIMTKMLPELIASSTDLPEGTVIQMAEPKAMDAAAAITGQYEQMGMLALILLFMGTIAGERASGVITTILIKPVSKWSYVGSKVLMAMLLITVSYLLSITVSWYYINQMFNDGIAFQPFLTGSLVYLPKLLVFAAIIVFCSSLTKSMLVAGGISFAAMIGLVAVNAVPWVEEHLPFGLGKSALAYMQEQSPDIGQPMLWAALLIIALYLGSCAVVSHRES